MPNKLNLNRFNFSKTKGFTIVELVVVVVVIGILSAIVILSYNSWKRATISAQLKSDLNNVSVAMENYRNFNNIYPSSIPDNMQPSEGVVLYGGSNDGGETYCVQASNEAYEDLTLYITSSSNTNAQEGVCPTSIDPPTTPVVTVTLNGSDVLATITPVTCTEPATAEYGIRSRTNDGIWSSWSAWSPGLTASRTANDGVKYGYQAQARCVDTPSISSTVAGIEGTYIDPISTPSARTISHSNSGSSTTWSWNATSCPDGTSARYQYRYTISNGYDSGLIATANTSVTFTTSTGGLTYTVAVQTQCYNDNATSSWSTSASDSYYRPFLNVLVVGGGGAGAPNLSGGGGGGGVAYSSGSIVLLPGSSTTVTVGAGGGHSGAVALSGGNSSFGAYLTGYGGGKASQRDTAGDYAAGGAGFGGGGGAGSYLEGMFVPNGGAAGQGGAGGMGYGYSFNWGVNSAGGGGGGASGAAGAAGNYNTGGNGGNGVANSITGVSTYYGGGGGGGSYYTRGIGGLGGGGQGDGGTGGGGSGGTAGTANTGGGGGGCFCGGGSGVVIISYPTGSMTATGGTITTSGGNTIHTFTTSGTFVVSG